MSFATRRPASAGSSRPGSTRSTRNGRTSRPNSAGSSRSKASSRNSMFNEYDNAIVGNRRELLIKLLQRETMKEAIFKAQQLRKGGGITPTEEVDDKARQMAEDLVNGNADILTEQSINQIETEENNPTNNARVPVAPPRLNIEAVQAANASRGRSRQRPMSARSDSRRSNRSRSSSRSVSPRPQSARSSRNGKAGGTPRSGRKENWSPMAEAIAKLYERTAHLRSPRPDSAGSNRPPRPKSAGSVRGRSSRSSRPSNVGATPAAAKPPTAKPPTPDSGFNMGQEVKARSHSRQDYRTARVIGKNSDGSYDLRYEYPKAGTGGAGAGRDGNTHIPRVSGIASVGIKRLKKIVREKIEQRCRSSSTGSMATVNPHVLKKMFKRFDTSGKLFVVVVVVASSECKSDHTHGSTYNVLHVFTSPFQPLPSPPFSRR